MKKIKKIKANVSTQTGKFSGLRNSNSISFHPPFPFTALIGDMFSIRNGGPFFTPTKVGSKSSEVIATKKKSSPPSLVERISSLRVYSRAASRNPFDYTNTNRAKISSNCFFFY